MSHCLMCGVQLDATNGSKEHIIPNALGGTLTSTKLVCRECNSKYGSDCDASLASDLKLFGNLLNAKRQRGLNQSVIGTTSTASYKIDPQGKPTITKPVIQVEETQNGKAIHIEATDTRQARQILEGLKRKYPEIDVEQTLSQAQHGERYLDEFVKLQFVFSGDNSLRSIAKMAYFLLKHTNPTIAGDYSSLVAFIRDKTNYREIYFYYPNTEIVIKPLNAIYHSIVINSYTADRLLVAFVELYSSLSFIVVLTSDFTDDFQMSYVFDVLNRTEVHDSTVTLPAINRAQLDDLFDNKPAVFQNVAEKFGSFLGIALDRQAESARSDMIQRAMKNSLLKHQEGAPITKEMMDEFVDALMQELTPLMVRNLRNVDE